MVQLSYNKCVKAQVILHAISWQGPHLIGTIDESSPEKGTLELSYHSYRTVAADMTTSHPYQALDIDERVKRVLLRTPLIDGHNDLPQQPRACFHGKIHNNEKFDLQKGFQRGMTDIPRLREGLQSYVSASDFWD